MYIKQFRKTSKNIYKKPHLMPIFGMGCGFLLFIFVVKYAYVQGNKK